MSSSVRLRVRSARDAAMTANEIGLVHFSMTCFRRRNRGFRKAGMKRCIIRAMPTIDSDGCRPPIPKHADQLFRRMASSFSGVPESVVALVRNQWTACSGIRRSRTDPIRSGAG